MYKQIVRYSKQYPLRSNVKNKKNQMPQTQTISTHQIERKRIQNADNLNAETKQKTYENSSLNDAKPRLRRRAKK